MKTIQIKFKTLLLLLLVGVAFASCSKEDMPDEPDPQSNLPITLDCGYFMDNPNAVLQDDPDAAVDYIITCVMKVNEKLTIGPGVVIAFEQNAGMTFTQESSFKMEGTAAKPILLTGTEQTKGFWRGLYTESPNTDNIMSYVTVDYAGGKEIGHGIQAALTIFRGGSHLTLDHCSFLNSKNTGMNVSVNFGEDEQSVFFTNCIFTNNDIPVVTRASNLRMFNATNSFSGNVRDYVYLEKGSLFGDATWAKLDVPYLMESSNTNGFQAVRSLLTIEPGTEIIMTARSRISIGSESSLVMLGTANEPIIIRGEQDVAGFWDNIFIASKSPLNEIGHVNIKNAGKTTGNPNGAILLGYSKFLNIHDVIFSDCFEYGISLDGRAGQPTYHLEYNNLSLNDTPKLFSDWDGDLVVNQ